MHLHIQLKRRILVLYRVDSLQILVHKLLSTPEKGPSPPPSTYWYVQELTCHPQEEQCNATLAG